MSATMQIMFVCAWAIKIAAALIATMAISRIVRRGIARTRKVCWKAKSLSYFFLVGLMLTGVPPLFRMEDHPMSAIICESSQIAMGVGTIGISIVFLMVKTADDETRSQAVSERVVNGSKVHVVIGA